MTNLNIREEFMPVAEQFYVVENTHILTAGNFGLQNPDHLTVKHRAEDWKEFLQSEDPKRKDDYFVIQVQVESNEKVD